MKRMKTNLCIFLSSTSKIILEKKDLSLIYNGKEITTESLSINGCKISIALSIPVTNEEHQLQIIKNIDERTVVNLDDITVDGISLPPWFLQEHGFFTFSDVTHQGSREWHPSGSWHLIFRSPMLTWILDQKILHESRYNQDYLFPWSYKFGPDTVTELGKKINGTIQKVNEIL